MSGSGPARFPAVWSGLASTESGPAADAVPGWPQTRFGQSWEAPTKIR